MTDKIKNLKKTVVIKYALVAVIVVYVALLLISPAAVRRALLR